MNIRDWRWQRLQGKSSSLNVLKAEKKRKGTYVLVNA